MKAIISHDLDHITVWEHLFRDTIIPKYMARMHVELLSGKISLREYTLRWSDFFKNKWQNVDELITFNNINGVPTSFFVAVNKGVGLNYSNEAAMLWIEQMQSRRCEIAVHGIEFDNAGLMLNEYQLFEKLTGQQNFGIRMHYVRNTEKTYQLLAETGYTYDSTEHAYKNPYKIGEMWEFPFQIMDGWIIENYKSWQSLNLEQAKINTIKLIDKAHEHQLQYLGIDFHDRYFSHSFKTWLDWYMWLVDYLKCQKIEFINFNSAIKELESAQA
ncbi:MAG: hypothetical protein IT236_17170 [Bacteroidia bacterium]|nr:hypothetical protein [Bacteroidia bacterium]